MPKKLTKEEFINREEDILSGEYLIVGAYKDTQTKVLIKHNKCGYEWQTNPIYFHRGTRCPKCAGNIKLTKEEFCDREEDIQSGEYEMLGRYVNTSVKTLFKHNVCGREWEMQPSSFHDGKRCPRCAICKRTLTKKEFCEREDDIVSGEYTMLGDYTTASKKTLFKHNICGYEWEVRPYHFHTGKRCPRCFIQTITFSKRDFCEREKDIVSGEYEFIGEYINNNTKTIFKHAFCGYKWEVRPSAFHSGNRCPKCKESKGEKKISKVLEEINIPFETQKRFNTCKYKNTLPFDFYVSNSFLIEYDGEQHFEPINFAGKGDEWADKKFKLGQLRDNIKTQWAKDNGIPLVRIPYTEFDNIEQIIRDSIEKYSIQKAG